VRKAGILEFDEKGCRRLMASKISEGEMSGEVQLADCDVAMLGSCRPDWRNQWPQTAGNRSPRHVLRRVN
jgi:hypothetical protein